MVTVTSLTNWRDHPRMCGEHVSLRGPKGERGGSSPHVRGARRTCRSSGTGRGIIPACAGSTVVSWSGSDCCRDHPRMCGEHMGLIPDNVSTKGSSPHVRGARGVSGPSKRWCGIIPACAGSTSETQFQQQGWRDHPRMCGEHFVTAKGRMKLPGSSPHVRGAHTEHRSR